MEIPNEIINQVASAISCAETVAQIGMVKLTGGIALYAAAIHEQDRKTAPAPPKVRRDAIGREV
jgi:hypothetical protein